jgi:hypothetical protein
MRKLLVGLLSVGAMLIAFASIGPSIASATALPSTITENTTLKPAGNPYTGSPTIAAGVTVTVEPGVILTLGSLTVKGTLIAEGTAEEPVVFTSSAKEPKAGDWNDIIFESGSGASVLNHVEVAYGGWTERPEIEVKSASPTIKNSTIRNGRGNGIQVVEGGSPEIASNSFYNNFARSISYTAGAGKSGEVNIHDNYVEGGTIGIYANVETTSVVGKTLSHNTVVGNSAAVGISYWGKEVPGDVTQNTVGATKCIELGVAEVTHSITWNNGGSKVCIYSSLTVASGVTLTINKGVYITSPNITVKGTLIAEGTAEEPVVFTGSKAEASGEWQQITFEPGSGASILKYTEIAYGGSGSERPAVEIKGTSPTIKNSTFRKNRYYAIWVKESGHPTIEFDRFRSNGGGLWYSGTGKLSAPSNDWGCLSGPKPAG